MSNLFFAFNIIFLDPEMFAEGGSVLKRIKNLKIEYNLFWKLNIYAVYE